MLKSLYKPFVTLYKFCLKYCLNLFDKDLEAKLLAADRTYMNIVDATYGDTKHFYNNEGVRVRGFSRRQYKFANVVEHPLLDRYR